MQASNAYEQQQLANKIKAARSRKLYMELFTYIVKSHTPYTRNKNGFFSTSQPLAPKLFPKFQKLCQSTKGDPGWLQ